MTRPTTLPIRVHRPLRTVLIGTALDAGADGVVRTGLAVARAAGARVALVHAVQIDALLAGFDVGAGAALKRDEVARGEEELRRQIERLEIHESEMAEATVTVGAPHRVIDAATRQAGAELLVVGASRSGPFGTELLGSTADRVLRQALCPVLIVRDGLVMPPRWVLAPVDLSPLSGDAFRCGLEVLAQIAGPDTAVRAVYALSLVDSLTLREQIGGIPLDQIERDVAGQLRQFVAANRSSAPFEVESAVLPGEARFEILREVEQHPVDLLILGTHGRGGWERLMLGSVVSTVARKAPCSMLVIPPEAALGEGIADAITSRLEPTWSAKPEAG